jgi:hypothetical protein
MRMEAARRIGPARRAVVRRRRHRPWRPSREWPHRVRAGRRDYSRETDRAVQRRRYLSESKRRGGGRAQHLARHIGCRCQVCGDISDRDRECRGRRDTVRRCEPETTPHRSRWRCPRVGIPSALLSSILPRSTWRGGGSRRACPTAPKARSVRRSARCPVHTGVFDDFSGCLEHFHFEWKRSSSDSRAISSA